jgi:hypothetical protein
MVQLVLKKQAPSHMEENNLASLLVGNWFIGNMPSGEEGILVITPDGRVVQFPSSLTKPRKNQVMRLWISEDKNSHVRFRASPSGAGWLRRLEMRGGEWTMIATNENSESEFPCRPALPASFPPWFDESLGQNLALMQERESRKSE